MKKSEIRFKSENFHRCIGFQGHPCEQELKLKLNPKTSPLQKRKTTTKLKRPGGRCTRPPRRGGHCGGSGGSGWWPWWRGGGGRGVMGRAP